MQVVTGSDERMYYATDRLHVVTAGSDCNLKKQFFPVFSNDDVRLESGSSSLFDCFTRFLPVVDYFYIVIQSHYCGSGPAQSLIVDRWLLGYRHKTSVPCLEPCNWRVGTWLTTAF